MGLGMQVGVQYYSHPQHETGQLSAQMARSVGLERTLLWKMTCTALMKKMDSLKFNSYCP